MAVTVYQYPKCSTCRKAIQWLTANGIEYRLVDIVTSPPSRAELDRARKAAGVPIKKLFNVSGESYRAGGWKERLAATSDADALAALAADGKLIKRPLVVGNGVALVGFDPDAWRETLT
jgi:arsenate reductase (glutaredoxin)